MKNGHSARLILPDLRYNKDTSSNDEDDHRLMSEDQWLWLEEIMRSSEDSVYLIGSGIQFLTSNRVLRFEVWPVREMERLVKHGVVLISGDVHHAQILTSNCSPFESAPGYNLLEVTTSGITHTCDKNILGMCSPFLDLITPKWIYKTEPIVDYNYMVLKLKEEEDGDLSLQFQLKGDEQRTFQTL
eukprot:CAMPEP_0168627930 /NCGR_PEP_ID=MMETSP0449_2-20121227/11565_1 /TAXON_ID=1082188 /ORGANISM="Strombidium rassoulzadegani, Strain ras09" /LENGTH=185 /DNA_ID=CAMNT_0008670299 /DNA_START=44 /DNA_END=601 /DNA_ORIENTATION=+